MTNQGQRGKYAETQVKNRLKKLESSSVVHHRFPDARAGSFTATLSDFMILKNGKLTLLEVKETQHARRLPYLNFNAAQIAKMRMWKAAGAQAHVLIFHSTEKLWRVGDVEWFFVNHITEVNGKAVASWVLDELAFLPSLDFYFENFL